MIVFSKSRDSLLFRKVLSKGVQTTFAIVVISLLSARPAIAADEFLQVYTELNMPNNYLEYEEGPVVGYVTELVREVLNETGIDYSIEIVPWIRAVQAIDSSPNVIVYSMARTVEREDKYHWIGKTLPLEFYLYGLKDRMESLPKTLEEAINSPIGVIRADVVALYLESQQFENLVYVRDPSLNLSMIERNRIDLFPYARREIGLFARRNGFNEDRLIGMFKLDYISNDLFLVASKDTSDSILQKLRLAYQSVIDSGEHDEIMNPLFEQYEAITVDVID